MSDFGNGRFVKSRKPHRCEWCYQPIDVGSRAYHYAGVFEREFQNWYMHPECEEVCSKDCDPDGFMPGDGERPKIEKKSGGGDTCLSTL